MKLILVIALVLAIVVALAMVLRSGGPRVTTIEHRRETDEKDDDDA